MADEVMYDDMPLTKVLKQWMDLEEWADEIEVNEFRNSSRVSTDFAINGQVYKAFIEVFELDERLSVYLYSPFLVPPPRAQEMARVVNRINMRLGLGRLGFDDDEDSNRIQFLATIDVEGGSLAVKQIGSMVGAAVGTFNPYGELLAAVALTKQSGDALWTSFLEEEAAAEAAQAKSEDESGPSEL